MPVTKPSLLKSSPERQAELLLLSPLVVPPYFLISASFLLVSNQSRGCKCCTNCRSLAEISHNFIHKWWCSPSCHELATCHRCHWAQAERQKVCPFPAYQSRAHIAHIFLPLWNFFLACGSSDLSGNILINIPYFN